MRSLVIAVVCLAGIGGLAQAVMWSENSEWLNYKLRKDRSYPNKTEDARRFRICMETKKRIDRHNAQGNSTFSMRLNGLSDWTRDELETLIGLKIDSNTLLKARTEASSSENVAYLDAILASSSEPVPDELDWSKVPGRVGPVKDQGQCASGWAFAAIGTLESQQAVHQAQLNGTQAEPLSEQQLIDCAPSASGCLGGWMADTFDDIAVMGGVQTAADYPYEAKNGGECKFDKNKSAISVKGHAYLPARDEAKLKQILAKFGPIAVAMEVTEEFLNYDEGVFDGATCSDDEQRLNHAVLLVGYGTDPKLGDYWKAKNSWSEKWGTKWGEHGHFRIKRGVNKCGIALYPTIPKF